MNVKKLMDHGHMILDVKIRDTVKEVLRLKEKQMKRCNSNITK